MDILSILLFAVSSNTDNFVLGISYGIKKIHVPIYSNILIATITFIGTLLSMFLGKSIASLVPATISNTIGCVILISIGLWNIQKYFHDKKKNDDDLQWAIENPEKYDENSNKKIELREAILLGLALSINNIGLGIGVSISGLSVLPTAMGSFIFSIIFLYFGNFIGNNCFKKSFGKYTEILSAIIIIGLGIWQIIF